MKALVWAATHSRNPLLVERYLLGGARFLVRHTHDAMIEVALAFPEQPEIHRCLAGLRAQAWNTTPGPPPTDTERDEAVLVARIPAHELLPKPQG
jgi:hypothetical protein